MPQGAPSSLPDGAATSVSIDPGGPAFEAAHKALLSRRRIQFDFPTYAEQPAPAPPSWMKALGELLKPLGHVMPYVFWAGVACAVGFLIYLLARELGWIRWRRKPRPRIEPAEYRPDVQTATVLLADADALAAEGRFAEAVHELLLRSIEDMRRRRPRALRPSLTSRDIALSPALPEPARPGFAAMAQVVERSLFGGRPVDRAEFESCRSAYETFAFPQAWS